MESLIGKQYLSRDNSYCENLSNGIDRILAGTAWQDAQVTTIICEPYDDEVSFMDVKHTYKFVNVQDSRREHHKVTFHPHGIVTESNTVEKMLNGDQFRNPNGDMFYFDHF